MKHLLLNTPHPLNQSEIYKGDAAEMACWATCAEMIVKGRDSSRVFARPTFVPPRLDVYSRDHYREIPEYEHKELMRYYQYVSRLLKQWGFDEHGGSASNWTADRLCDLMQERGPLLCSGWFPPAKKPDKIIHAIVVYGNSDRLGGVKYINPKGGTLGSMNLETFNSMLHFNFDSVQALKITEDNCEGDPLVCFKQKQEYQAETESLGRGKLSDLTDDILHPQFTKVPEFIKVPEVTIKKR
jgi:Papain-like cysteine protease AvrRpt2